MSPPRPWNLRVLAHPRREFSIVCRGASLGSGEASNGIELQIEEQGEIVRALKAEKAAATHTPEQASAAKEGINAAVTKLLSLKGQLSGVPPPVAPPSTGGGAGVQRVRIEETSKGRGGKTATVIKGLEELDSEEAKQLLKSLKASVSVYICECVHYARK